MLPKHRQHIDIIRFSFDEFFDAIIAFPFRLGQTGMPAMAILGSDAGIWTSVFEGAEIFVDDSSRSMGMYKAISPGAPCFPDELLPPVEYL